jgi:ABC-type cobalamin/Fe3+-siderophores transport system ATPase subunit
VENVRCFRERQVLDLSDGDGKPARWTVLLGDNGTGKTTLLQSLVVLEPTKVEFEIKLCKGVLITDCKFSRYGDKTFEIKTSKFYVGQIESCFEKNRKSLATVAFSCF